MLGNCLNEVKARKIVITHPESGICFETQNFPDANHEHFPSSILKDGSIIIKRSINFNLLRLRLKIY
jgi:aldose 1-epimerase